MKSIKHILFELAHSKELAEQERQVKDQLEQLVSQMYSTGILYAEAVREFKKRFIMNVIQQNRGNQCKAARELGMHRNTLSRTITELKLDVRQLRDGGRKNPRYQPPRQPVQPAAMAAAAGVRQA